MPATAAARRAGGSAPRSRPRTGPARRRPPARARAASQRPRGRTRTRATPPFGLIPVAVGRTAVAVGGLADSGLMVRMTRSRLWIGALGALLAGIVALNVLALSLSAGSSRTAAAAEELSKENSALRARIASELSNERIQAAAAGLGLLVPDPDAIRYLRYAPGDAELAAERLASGEIAAGSGYHPESVPVPVEPNATQPPPTDSPAPSSASAPPPDEAAAEGAAASTFEPAPAGSSPEPQRTAEPQEESTGGAIAAP